jgi:translation initiation factor 2 beta subunit (eIF-2beta)/eIF-5
MELNNKMINMDGSVDQFYRYKIECPIIKIEGSGKMIKTKILNINTIENLLYRSAELLLSYYCIKLGCNKLDNMTISGNHSQQILTDLMIEFINKYILCIECKNPETVCKISGSKKNKIIKVKCKSCGHRYELDDNNVKMIKSIISFYDTTI